MNEFENSEKVPEFDENISATYEVTVPIIVRKDGTFYPDIPAVAEDGEVEGLIYTNGNGVRLGGMEGYADGELTRITNLIKSGVTKGITATIIIHTSPEKMMKWHNEGWADAKGEKKALKVKGLKSEKAQAKRDELIGFKESADSK
jgi:hypothetical protein